MTDSETSLAVSGEARLRAALLQNDMAAVEELLVGLPPSEALRITLVLEKDTQSELLARLQPETAARLIEEAPDELAAELFDLVEAKPAAKIVEQLGSDNQADVITSLDTEDAEAILAQMDPQEVRDVRRLSQYEPNTAGGLMLAEAFAFHIDESVGSILRQLASDDDDFERYRGQHPYVVDGGRRLRGVVSLRSLLTSPRRTALRDIMVDATSVDVGTELSDLQDIFDANPFLGIPVVDRYNRLVGAVSRTAVAQAILERTEAESLKVQGVIGDELRSMPTSLRARRRLAWLSANIVLNVIAASVISAYESTLAAVIAIAVFLPMVSDMSGCSGNQAVAVTLRELALGLVRPIDMARVWLKEISIGVINGLALGVLIGLVAWFWKGNAFLGVVIGVALALNTMIAVSIGGVVPLVLKRFGADPAVASGPLLTTVTDMAGFFLVLSLATLMMPWLV